ncbi:hypothetical protein KIPB_001106, partial [Kipferlia bialata]
LTDLVGVTVDMSAQFQTLLLELQCSRGDWRPSELAVVRAALRNREDTPLDALAVVLGRDSRTVSKMVKAIRKMETRRLKGAAHNVSEGNTHPTTQSTAGTKREREADSRESEAVEPGLGKGMTMFMNFVLAGMLFSGIFLAIVSPLAGSVFTVGAMVFIVCWFKFLKMYEPMNPQLHPELKDFSTADELASNAPLETPAVEAEGEKEGEKEPVADTVAE